MRNVILYSISALSATALVVIWIMYPEGVSKSPYPSIAKAYMIVGIAMGYLPLIFGIVFKSKKAHPKV